MMIGVCLACITYIFLVFISSVVYSTYSLADISSTTIFKFFAVLYFAIAFLAGLSHFICMFKSPGYLIPAKYSSKDSCPKCLASKVLGTHHCSRCQKCVLKMDHHCYWVNTCVGMYNQKIYILFLVYIALFCSSSAVLITAQKVYCEIYFTGGYCAVENGIIWKEYCKMIALIISLFFCAFVVYLLFEQYESISINVSKIDRLKGVGGEADNCFWRNLEVVFGGKASIWWLIPVSKSESDWKRN